MFTLADLPTVIPVFPLPGALLLPRGKLPLHIFEPRYLAMLDDTLKSDHRLIGMVQPVDGNKDRLHDIGCAGRVSGFQETEDGRYMITLSGIARFRIETIEEGFTPYLKAQVDFSGFARDLGKQESDTALDRDAFFNLLARYFEHSDLKTDWDNLKEADDEMLINALSMMLPLEPEDKQALLEAPSLTDRRAILTTLFEFTVHGGEGEGRLQ